ncbi:hypothetical protein PHISCL_02974 [Aspergillus sclerotialis]|uniref:Uncharacterized protein n=1 Tax=Aspergillus sclerotialis TaxID=2070753 RepID=A0A3A2ZNA2_9EURO|nr:hypothetical protein PHISCL_02974 [Aspergillus sclerotialis]
MPHGSTMYRPVSNHGLQYDPALLASAIRERRSRPISWHPASHMGYSTPYYQASVSQNATPMEMPLQPLNANPYGDDANMFLYPMQALQLSNDSFAPFPAFQDPTPMQQQPFLQTDPSLDPSWDVAASNIPTMTQPMPETCPFDMMSMNNSIPSADVAPSCYESVPSSGVLTGPSTPEFLPIQKFDDEPAPLDPAINTQESGDELVGMGLYNSPGMLETSRQGVSGKGLKLEETFTPSPDNEGDKSAGADDDDDDDDDDNAVDGLEPSLKDDIEPIKQPMKPPGNLLHKSFFFDDDEFESHAVTDTQPFIGFGDQSCMSYGYGWI